MEQSALHSHISAMLDDNQNLSSKLEKYQKMTISDDVEHLRQQLRLANEALSKALSQIDRFKTDRQCLQKIQECANRTIKNMETELLSYRTQFSKGDNQKVSLQKFKTKIGKFRLNKTVDIILKLHINKN